MRGWGERKSEERELLKRKREGCPRERVRERESEEKKRAVRKLLEKDAEREREILLKLNFLVICICSLFVGVWPRWGAVPVREPPGVWTDHHASPWMGLVLLLCIFHPQTLQVKIHVLLPILHFLHCMVSFLKLFDVLQGTITMFIFICLRFYETFEVQRNFLKVSPLTKILYLIPFC